MVAMVDIAVLDRTRYTSVWLGKRQEAKGAATHRGYRLRAAMQKARGIRRSYSEAGGGLQSAQ